MSAKRDDADDVSGLSYQDAVDELEAILVEIEDDAVDIDQLSRRVRRAAALVRLCQERIAGARLEVERVVADLTLAGPAAARPAGATDDDGAGGLDEGADDADGADPTGPDGA